MMKESTGMIATFVVVVVVILGLTWLVQGNEFFLYRTFAPKMEGVRREVFEETKSYNQGMIQELQNMQFQYEQAAPEHRAALASIILHRAADYDESRLPPSLRSFIQKLRSERTER